MPIRFELLKNGKHFCTSGIAGTGELIFNVSHTIIDDELQFMLQMVAIGLLDASQLSHGTYYWPVPELEEGDELTIRVLPPGEFDPPTSANIQPYAPVADPDFGQINYCHLFWTCITDFASPPFESALVHILADEQEESKNLEGEEFGPTDEQRRLFRELPQEHAQLWPQIRDGILRLVPNTKDIESLMSRLDSRVYIKLYDDSYTIEVFYHFNGDEDHQRYFAIIRDWKVFDVRTTT